MRMNWMFLSTSDTFHIKGPDGEPGGGENRLLIVIFFFIFIKLKIRFFFFVKNCFYYM